MSSDFSDIRTSDKSTVIFLHIHKTAGSALDKIIRRQYRPFIYSKHGFFPQEVNDEIKALPIAKREKLRYITGPMYFGVHEFLPQPSTYVTILRDPVDRIISHYYMVLRSPADIFYNEVTSRKMSLKDFASSGLLPELENGQTRFLSGVGAEVGFGQCSNEILERAKTNLREHFIVVGLRERFDETVVMLKKAFGWRNVFYIKDRPKKRLLKEAIPKETLAVIEKYNQLDIELYTYAKKRFDELICQQGPSFERELRNFRSLNKVYAKVYGSIYESLRPMTKGFRRWLKAGRAVCLTIVSTSLLQSVLFTLDDII